MNISVADFHATSRYLADKDVRLIAAGVPRSGSTLVWQLACDILGPHVPKTHTFLSLPRVPVIMTIRDPRDCMASQWHKGFDNVPPTTEDVIRLAAEYRMWFCHADFYASSGAVILRYEDFWNNYGIIFDAIDAANSITTETSVRESLSVLHSVEANRLIAESLDDQHDPQTHIHRRHIGGVVPGMWRQLFSADQQALATQILLAIVRHWNYPIETRHDAA